MLCLSLLFFNFSCSHGNIKYFDTPKETCELAITSKLSLTQSFAKIPEEKRKKIKNIYSINNKYFFVADRRHKLHSYREVGYYVCPKTGRITYCHNYNINIKQKSSFFSNDEYSGILFRLLDKLRNNGNAYFL